MKARVVLLLVAVVLVAAASVLASPYGTRHIKGVSTGTFIDCGGRPSKIQIYPLDEGVTVSLWRYESATWTAIAPNPSAVAAAKSDSTVYIPPGTTGLFETAGTGTGYIYFTPDAATDIVIYWR